MHSQLWIEERYKDIYTMKYRVDKTLFSGKSEYQTVDVVETRSHGKMLFNDGLVMVSERDEFVYHDMITHVPLFTHPNPEKVLIIGGGDGGTAREVLRHKSVKKCVMVEIDRMVVDACREFIPQTSKDLDDPRMELIFGDGVKYVKETEEKFDVILVDSTDPIGPATPLFGVDFYRDVHKTLSDNGIVVSQGETPFFAPETQSSLLSILNNLFEKVLIYNFSNITYPGGLWSFTFATKGLHPIKDFDEKRVTDSNLEFQYYNSDIHRAAFALPQFMKNNIEKFLRD
jgi:spermidine synthase